MAWNRSCQNAKHCASRNGRSVSVATIVAYGAPLMLLCGVALWWAINYGKTHSHSEAQSFSRGKLILETETRLFRSNAVVTSAVTTRVAGRARGVERGPTNKVELTKNVKPPTVLGCNYYECVSGGRPLFTKPIFTNSAENIIGGLLSARPGERFIPVELGEDFDNDFIASLKIPIVITENDSGDTTTLKEAVIKAKLHIAESMTKGLKPSEIITSMRDEMNKIADYKDLLQEDFDKLKETGSAQQIEAYLKEANMLLDEFGAEHLELPEDEVEEINKRLDKNVNENQETIETKE